MAPRLSGQNYKYLKFLLSLNPDIKLKLIKLVIKETKSFLMKCPLIGSCKSCLELQVNVFFCHFNFVNKVPTIKCLNNVLVSAISIVNFSERLQDIL